MRAGEVVEDEIAAASCLRVASEHEMGLKPDHRSAHRGEPRVVRLDGADRDETVRALEEGIGHHLLQLPRLVAAHPGAGEIVTLYVQLT